MRKTGKVPPAVVRNVFIIFIYCINVKVINLLLFICLICENIELQFTDEGEKTTITSRTDRAPTFPHPAIPFVRPGHVTLITPSNQKLESLTRAAIGQISEPGSRDANNANQSEVRIDPFPLVIKLKKSLVLVP